MPKQKLESYSWKLGWGVHLQNYFIQLTVFWLQPCSCQRMSIKNISLSPLPVHFQVFPQVSIHCATTAGPTAAQGRLPKFFYFSQILLPFFFFFVNCESLLSFFAFYPISMFHWGGGSKREMNTAAFSLSNAKCSLLEGITEDIFPSCFTTSIGVYKYRSSAEAREKAIPHFPL